MRKLLAILFLSLVVRYEVTVWQGDMIKNLALTSSLKAGIGGLVEGEVSGRFAAAGGPSFETNAGIIKPELPEPGGNE